jgi:para-aminobenzoate synthetase / 4-amino-4-deoxychorismate lyase
VSGPTRLYAERLDLALELPEVVRRLHRRARVVALSGRWACGGLVTCDPVRVATPDDDPFTLLTDLPAVVPDPARPGAVGGGWFGHLPFAGPAVLGYHRDVLRHDGAGWWYEALLDAGFGPAEAAERRAGLLRDLRVPAPGRAALELLAPPDPGPHLVAVEQCVRAIRRGEVYQANIATRLDLRLHGSRHDAFARLVEALDPAHAALVADGDAAAVSASPELFLRRRGTTVVTEPIKGTRPRTGGPDDLRERAALAA